MKAEEIYELGPECVTSDMVDAVADNLKELLGRDPKCEEAEGLEDLLLEVAQRYYRLGAFSMEHKDGATCGAEDQGGWPCCKSPAEFFVQKEHLLPKETRRLYCSEHRADNRFFRADQMSPIYENPSGTKAG